MKMRPSFYLKTYPWPEDPEQLLLFSTRKGSLALVERKTFRDLERGTLAADAEARLAALGMAVPEGEAEKQTFLGLLDELNPRNRGLKIVAVLNLDCNFACPYCFEEGVKGNLYMTAATAGRLVSFIRDQWRGHMDTLRLDFYGGEPLLSLELLTSLAQAAQSFASSQGAAFSFTLVTNGSLFTRKTAERLVPLGLQSIKITLDGPPELHNRSRPFQSGAGSFKTLIGNIKDTCDLVKISIGGNFTRENYEQFPRLLDYLLAEGLGPDQLSYVKFDPIVNRPPNSASPIEYTAGCVSLDEPWMRGAEALLRGEIMQRGYQTPRPTPMACMVETTDSYVVNYDGVLYKCPAFIGKEGFAVGDLAGGVSDYAASLRLGIYKNPDCAACVYLPMCYGGCRYMTLVKDGNIDKIDCKKAYFDATLETLLKQDIRYRSRK